MQFYKQQINTSGEIREAFSNNPYVILLAQMQSGKSGTYLHCACDMIHNQLCDNVLILSGVSDTTLREQTKTDLENAIKKFTNENGEQLELYLLLKDKINIYWGTGIKNIKKAEIENTLIIVDESHYAQSKDNMLYKKFTKLEIEQSLCNDFDSLKQHNIKILNVSATPFSELIENSKQDREEKEIIIMKPGDGNEEIATFPYIGVPFFHKTNKIIYEAKKITNGSYQHIKTTLSKEKYNNKYCIVRTAKADKDEKMMMDIARETDCEYIKIFGGAALGCFDILKDKPEKKTLIHICGKCRMGQVLEKEFIGMVYESSENANVDTLLQGLLGRMCGYHQNIDIDIYISKKWKEEIIKYIRYVDENEEPDYILQIAPAMNVKPMRSNKHYGDIVQDKDGNLWIKIVPIKFKLHQIKFDGERQNVDNVKVNDLENLFDDYPELIDRNQDKEQIIDTLTKDYNPENKIYYRNNNGNPLHFDDAIDKNNRYNGNLNANIRNLKTEKVKQFTLVQFTTDIYLTGYVRYHGENPVETPEVQKKCNYTTFKMEFKPDELVVENNGGQLNCFPQKTMNNPDIFEIKLEEFINRTAKDHINYTEDAIKGIYCDSNNKKGIRLSKSVFDEKKINTIIDNIRQKCKVKINMEKFRGRQPGNYFRYKSITWTFN